MNDRHELAAAKLGCGRCGGPVRMPPSGRPLQEGAYQGRYLCPACWTVIWDENPSSAGEQVDADTRAAISKTADEVRQAVGAQVLFEEETHQVLLTQRGTLMFHLDPSPGQHANEYDRNRFAVLLRALQVISRKRLPGFDALEETESIESVESSHGTSSSPEA